MPSTYNVSQLAQEFFDNLGSPSDISIPVVANYIRNNIGALNNLLGLDISIDSTTLNFDSDLTDAQKAIFFKLYEIYYVDKIIRDNTGASAFSAVLEVTSDGATVRKVSPTNVVQNYLQLRKQYREELNDMVNGYKLYTNNGSVDQVAGDDYISIFDNQTDYPYSRNPRERH